MNTLNFTITKEYLQKQKNVILLDDSTSQKETSYLFINPIKTIVAFNENDFLKALAEIDHVSKKYYLAGYINYEAGHFFTEKEHRPKQKKPTKNPLLYFGVYKNAISCNVKHDTTQETPYTKILKTMSLKSYTNKINKIKKEIEAGNTYQVNYTFNKQLKTTSSPESLYLFLRQKQPTKYSAFIKNEYLNILSFSPELFFMRKNSHIETHPMKGTAPRGKTKEKDLLNLRTLTSCEKNKAENLMIVDLIRNDLSHIAKKNSVKVSALFKTETLKTLHQMTSQIEATLKENISYSDIFKALFPCGSITGAPKIKTMSLIDSLETHSRDVYCGTIGYISPKKEAVFNIPIRTLQKNKKATLWNYKTGSGIVWDSEALSEYKECSLKSSFLTNSNISNFEIVETMLLKNKKIAYEKEHIDRMKKSALFFNFTLNIDILKKELTSLKNTGKHGMLRILLSQNGQLKHEIIPVAEPKHPLYITIAKEKLNHENIFLKHKTTHRPWYDKSMQKIKKNQIWDEIFINTKNEICEGARSNIFIEKNKTLYTPPLSCGLLNGILRADLISKNKCIEKKLTLKDLQTADQIYCGNSVRGLIPVTLK